MPVSPHHRCHIPAIPICNTGVLMSPFMCAELVTGGQLPRERADLAPPFWDTLRASLQVRARWGTETQLRHTLLPMFVQTAVHSYVPFWLQPCLQCRYGRLRPSAAVRTE